MTAGQFGSCPSWYRLILAADRLHVPVWELAEKPAYWTDIALKAQAAERKAEAALRERARTRAQR